MDCIYNELLFIHKGELNLVGWSKKDWTGGHYVKWNMPDWNISTTCSFSYVFKKI
jgi:hypothetical protein